MSIYLLDFLPVHNSSTPFDTRPRIIDNLLTKCSAVHKNKPQDVHPVDNLDKMIEISVFFWYDVFALIMWINFISH